METEDEFKIGARVLCDENFGTIRYVGPVDKYQGLWIGIDWDDVSRGKHDGSVANKRYFESRHPTSASFVRPKKLDLGHEFLEAVKDKYGPFRQGNDDTEADDCETSEPSHELLVLNMKSSQARAVDFVGGDRVIKYINNWSRLERLTLDRQRVNGIRKDGDQKMLSAFTSTSHLLLRANLLSSWQQVADICSILPRLKNLDISENRIEVGDGDGETLVNGNLAIFSKIDSLVMHRLNYTWNDVAIALKPFTSLTSLGLSFNSISNIFVNSSVNLLLSSLTLLDLVGNSIESWSEVLKLGFMKKLEELHVDECGLSEVFFPDAKPTDFSSAFPELKHLTLDFNKISEWRSISELAKLKSLRELRVRRNPVYHLDDITAETARQLVIARLPRIAVLNGSEVLPEERRGAEIDYVTHLAKKWIKASKEQKLDDFTNEHPMFDILLDKFKLRTELIGKEAQARSTIDSSVITLEIGLVKFGSTDKPILRRVSANVAIAKLKILAKRVLKLSQPPGSLTLSYQSLKNPELVVSLDKDSKELSFFSIENGDTVIVQCEN